MLVVVALAVPACGPAVAATSPPPAPTAGDAFSSFVAGEIVTPQDVANVVGGPIFRELEQEPGPGCLYEVEAGPDGYAQFIVYIHPTNLIESLMEALPDELGQPGSGMGGTAYLEYDEAADT